MGVATLGFAIDEEDWYTVGRASVGVGVTILAAIVGKKLAAGTRERMDPSPGDVTPQQARSYRRLHPLRLLPLQRDSTARDTNCQ